MNHWVVADRLSDRIVDAVNDELDAMRAANAIDPIQLLVGQMLALLAFMHTAPTSAPDDFQALGVMLETLVRKLHSARAMAG